MNNTVVANGKLVPFVTSMFTLMSEQATPDGYRLSVIRWKVTKEKTSGKEIAARPAICVAVPRIQLAVMPEVLKEAMQEALETMQDNAIRSVVNGMLEASSGCNLAGLIIDSSLGTAEGLASFQATEAISNRLSKELLTAWFSTMLEEPLGEALAVLPMMTEEKLKVAIEQHRKMIVSLAASKVVLGASLATQLQRAIRLAPEGDRVKGQLMTKLEFFANPPSSGELLASL